MKKFLLFLTGILLFSLAGAPKIAVFDEPGFPNASKRNAQFYSKVLGGKILRLKELSKLKDFDTVIFPHGGYVPAAAESAVYQLMRRGGTVIVCGDLQQPLPEPSVKRPKVRNAATLEFNEKYGLDHGGPLSLVNGRWIVAPVGAMYDEHRANRWFEFFSLFGWPNHAQSYAPHYMREFKTPLFLNPVFKKSALPVKIAPPAKKMLLARLRPMGTQGDNALDIFHPLYQFSAPGKKNYPAFPMAGKSAEDRDGDGFIYRKFRPDMFGATLVVMGQTGRILLDSPEGEKTIREIVKLANSPLPGSFPKSYIKRVHVLEKAMQDYNLAYADLDAALRRQAVENFVSGKHNPQLVRLKTLSKEFAALNNQFDGLMLVKDRRKTIPAGLLATLTSSLKKAAAALKKEVVPLKKYILPRDLGNAKHPYKNFTFMTSNFGPWHVDNPNWKKVRDLGVQIARINAPDWKMFEQLNKRYGLKTTSIAIPMHRSHPDKKFVPSGVFNPASGTVKKVRARVWEKSAPNIDPAVIRNLEASEKSSAVCAVIHGDERDFQWSLWGEYMQNLFRKYLAGKYKNISALNKEYNAKYTSFEQIVLPLKRPETQTEHALWEDWTRYREIYRQENELARWVNMIKKYAPSKRQWLYGSYHLQPKHPANGINFYETGKWLNPASFESCTNPRKEVMTYDIATFGKKHVNPEWAGFYFPAGSRVANMNRMREFLWNEANCGTISWHTFMGGVQTRSNWTHTPLITPNGNFQPEGLALRNTARELNAARQFFLDGNRMEPEVRFIYSPTTRRHTSWPGIEDDRSYICMTGLNEAFKALHIPARGIDEQAVWEGKLPAECRFLIVPAVEYMNRKLFASLMRFMQRGGTVIASPESGRFDEYGHRKDFLLELAGVRAKKTVDSDFDMFSPEKLEILFPEETRVLLRYNDGSAALTTTRVGKGNLVICGYPSGREFNNTGKGFVSFQKMIAAVGINRPFICNDPNFVIRPWILNGKLYLACYYIRRDTVPVAKGDFPLRSAPVMIPFSINISGIVNAFDYTAGTPLKVVHKNNETIVSGLIGNPGGCIISLSKKTLPPRIMKIQQSVKVSSAVSAQKSFNLPASGKFFAEWGKIKLGKYTLTLSAENDGAWQGKVFASLSDGTRTLKRECTPNSNVIFRFNSKTVVFRCRTAQSYMPVLVSGTFSEKDNKTVSGCRFDEDDGRIILQNSYLYAVILPQFGGRIGRLSVSSDTPNQLLLSEKTLSEGVGQSYRDFGGIEYNPGMYQGPGWQIPYSFKVLKKSKKEILIRLNRSGQYNLRKGGKISYEIFYRITADSPFLETEVRIFNDMDSSAKLSFRTHPEFIAGGDCSVQDIFCWKSPTGPDSFSYRPGRNQYVPNSGNYFAWLDSVAGEGVLQTFTPAAIPRLYVWNGRTCYNSELHFVPVQTPPGKFASFKFDSAPIAGISRIDALADSFAAGFDFENKSVQILGLKSGKKNFVFSLLQNDKVLARSELKNVQLAPQKDFMLKLKKIVLPPGKYSLLLSDGKVSFFKSFTVKPQQSQDSSRELENLKQQYKTSPSPALRHRLFRFFSR